MTSYRPVVPVPKQTSVDQEELVVPYFLRNKPPYFERSPGDFAKEVAKNKKQPKLPEILREYGVPCEVVSFFIQFHPGKNEEREMAMKFATIVLTFSTNNWELNKNLNTMIEEVGGNFLELKKLTSENWPINISRA